MNFNSLQFLIFLLVVLAAYWVMPKRLRWVLLLGASYYFYMSWNKKLIILIVATTLVSYAAGLILEKTRKEALRKAVMVITTVVCLGALVFFKYFNFLSENVVSLLNLFSLKIDYTPLDIVLPIGISFYTFQTLSYVIDVYRGTFKAERHLGYYALFICFFPQLVAGPIERPGDLIPQLKKEHFFNFNDFLCGLRIMLVGFFYKVAIADVVSIYVNRVFANAAEVTGLAVLLAGCLFAVQIYCDFAGYSEIAVGAARMMGIRITRNFNRPYMVRSCSDFFRRWHITLTRWFKDYVYYPLCRKHKGAAARIINTFVVFALCGLWHGADWTFVIWGLYNAVFICLERIINKRMALKHSKNGKGSGGRSRTILRAVMILMMLIPQAIIFRASNLKHMMILFTTLFTRWNVGNGYLSTTMKSLGANGFSVVQVVALVIGMVMIFDYGEIGREKPFIMPEGHEGDLTAARHVVIGVFVTIIIALSWLSLLSTGSASEFQYFQF